jgi:hypothetical protein
MKHFWAVFVVIGLFHAFSAYRSIQAAIAKDPEKAAGYRVLFPLSVLATLLPWLLMGAFIVFGGVGSPWSFLEPWRREPLVLAWWGILLGMAVLFLLWVLGSGAELLEKYPALPFVPRANARKIRIIFLLAVGWNLVMGTFMFFGFPFFLSSGRSGSSAISTIFPMVFPFFFAAIWVLAGWMLAQTGGWAALAETYPLAEPFEGKSVRGCSGDFGGMGKYNGALTLGASQQGFYLSVIFLFRFGHKPIFIPWAEITCSEQPGPFGSWVVLHFKRMPDLILRLRQKDVLKLKARAEVTEAFPGIT